MFAKKIIEFQVGKIGSSIVISFFLLTTLLYGQKLEKQTNSKITAKIPAGNPSFQSTGNSIKIIWEGIKTIDYTESLSESYLKFTGATFSSNSNQLPIFTYKEKIKDVKYDYVFKLSNLVFEDIDESILHLIPDIKKVGLSIKQETRTLYFKKKPYCSTSFVPIKKNSTTGKYQKLISASIELIPLSVSNSNKPKQTNSFAVNSVLESGDWHKLSISKSGIYKLSYLFLQQLGIDVANINPQNIRIFGNGGGMLPFSNSSFRYDDLQENSIDVIGEADGSFDSSDYVLFYGTGPDKWEYNNSESRFEHQKNLYSTKTCYFLTTNGGSGIPKRIENQNNNQSSNTTVNSFDDFAFHENDLYNLLISGREWYGEKFDAIKSNYSFGFSFPNIASSVSLRASVIGRAISPASSSFTISANGQSLPMNLSTGSVQGSYLNIYGNTKTDNATFSSGESISVTMSFVNPSSSSSGWLNYLELNARRSLSMHGDQMLFRDVNSIGTGNIAKYILSNTTSSIKIWDVTNELQPLLQQFSQNGNSSEFSLPSDSLKEFIAFTGINFFTPNIEGPVLNQNIHGTIGQPDFVIVTHPLFLSHANSLASHRETNDGLDVYVATTTQVFNEFSSGSQDITAIKDLMRMLYNRAIDSTEMPRYLLLFGDGSYDNLDRISGNTNFIPTYQSLNSHHPISSYVSDDYYGLLDNNEGEGVGDNLDIGIGRFPVKTTQEADQIINKIFSYESSASLGSWRNNICFIADDEDNNIHISAADKFASHIDTTYPNYDIDKIYLDAYPQQSTPAGQRYPDVTQAINRRVEKGALIINYTGHGGELGWAHERILENTDIKSWSNIYNMPLFMTATCEFSRFDDPERSAAGEYVFLNPEGGGIALLTTVRLVQSGSNETLTNNFYASVFNPINNEMPRLGDIVVSTKNSTNNDANSRKYLLIGDPSMQLAYPKHNVVTDSINGSSITGLSDTLKALSQVTISGKITTQNGLPLTSFNGTIYPTVYDKSSNITTLKNDGGSNYKTFSLQKNVLFKGKASVSNGLFSFSFIMPKDISYENGTGRVSYYAENGSEDANGPYENFIIGGTAKNFPEDNEGPEISLYLNDSSFVFGGLTDESPTLVAYLFDKHGINTTGNGIGHDLVALIDEESENPIILNDEYESNKDDYKRGTVSYPLSSITEGRHELSLKAWDVYNNSSKTFTEFVVSKSATLALSHVLNYPNPFTTYTEFWFEHNRPRENLKVQIQIFTISGKLIKSIQTNINTIGYRPDPKQINELQWNGRDDFGDKIGRGVYVYKIAIKTEDGASAEKFEKLVILN